MINQGIYKITNLINHKCYVGKTNNFERRKKDHFRLAKIEGHKEYNKSLYQAIRKYGEENFSFDILESLEDYSKADEKEKYWIQKLDSFKNGYNESKGGDGGSSKGHCQGSQNGRSLLSEQDIIYIRTLFQQGCSRQEAYEPFKEKISINGFSRIWNGTTWTHIMPEVYTKENINRNAIMGKQKGGLQRRKLTIEEVKQIRKWRQEGITYQDIANKLKNKVSLSTIKDVGNYRTYREVE